MSNDVVIRDAVQEDFAFISSLMVKALEPYYDGDHEAHAARIFNVHIHGGHDKFGHFSLGQRISIITFDGIPVGMINLVIKRQGTFKISPLIIDESWQGKKGLGSQLIEHVEQYAKENGARQIYCTVAEQNTQALQFFIRKGYSIAGHSESHYKSGVTEAMMYKLFSSMAADKRFDRASISVVPLKNCHLDQVRSLILSRVPKHFNGVDDGWVDALFEGYERRNSDDVNEKYKLIFVATNSRGNVLGVIAATPKKGQPIKIMPCVAKTIPAFTALIADITNLVREYGHKLYIHIVPSPKEVIVLQRLGWTLDAAMPAAYHDGHTTHQWSLSLEEKFMRTMRVKQTYFELIKDGQKPLEVRVGYSNIKKIRSGEKIRLLTSKSSMVIVVTDVRRYDSFEEMLGHERHDHIVPMSDSQDETLELLQKIYPQRKEDLGVIVLEIKPA